jgi:hypothetical protein
LSGANTQHGASDAPDEGGGAPTAAERDWDAATDDAARRMGWKPKEEYKGDAANWVDAATFVRRTQESPAVMAERYRVLDARFAKLNDNFVQSQRTVSEMADMLRRSDQRARERVMRELTEQRKLAVQQGDTEAFDRVEREIAEANKDAPPARQPESATRAPAAAAPGAPQPAPEVIAWSAKNPWFMSDPDMRAFAESQHLRLNRSNPELSLQENLERVTEATMRAFPDEFRGAAAPVASRPHQPAVAAVAAATEGTSSTRRPSPKSFEALPKEAKDQFERWAKMVGAKGKPLTKQEFADNYWEQEE